MNITMNADGLQNLFTQWMERNNMPSDRLYLSIATTGQAAILDWPSWSVYRGMQYASIEDACRSLAEKLGY